MIDFELLNRLMSSARNPSAGKPLDKVRRLTKGVTYSWCHEMRSCRLFKVNDTKWRVTLHDNTIATITELDDGCAQITIHNVISWPTNTTAARLTSVLGLPVYKRDNKLRAYPKNCKAPRGAVPPPLVDWLMFHSGPAGVVCMNPEVITEPRTRILKEPSKPVLAYLRKIKALAVTMIRIDAVTPAELASADKTLPCELDTEIDTDLVMRVVWAGAAKEYGHWRVDMWKDRHPPLSTERMLQLLDAGLRRYKDELYSAHGVYEKYTHSFADQFEEVRRGQ